MNYDAHLDRVTLEHLDGPGRWRPRREAVLCRAITVARPVPWASDEDEDYFVVHCRDDGCFLEGRSGEAGETRIELEPLDVQRLEAGNFDECECGVSTPPEKEPEDSWD